MSILHPDKKQEVVALLERNMAAKAKVLCNDLCQHTPDDTEAWMLLAAINAQLAHYGETITACRKVLALEPNHQAAHYNIGVALQLLGKLDEAAEEYRNLTHNFPGHVAAYNNLGQVLRIQGKPDEATACFRKAASLEPDRLDIKVNLGLSLTDQNRLDEALVTFKNILATEPRNHAAHNHLGVIFLKLSRHVKAETHFLTAIQLDPETALYHYNLGNLYQRQSRYPEAIQEYLTAVDLDPAYMEAWNNLGQTTQARGELANAIDYYRKGLKFSPDSAALYNNLSYTLWLSGAYNEAFKQALHAVRLDPDNRLFRQNFVQITQMLVNQAPDPEIIIELENTFSYRGIDHQSLTAVCLHLLSQKNDLATLLKTALENNSERFFLEMAQDKYIDALNTKLLKLVLYNTVIINTDFERLLKILRQAFLNLSSMHNTESTTLLAAYGKDLLCALACQCFNNEYIYLSTSGEDMAADILIENIGNQLENCNNLTDVLQSQLIIACMYTPLYRIRQHQTLLKFKQSSLDPAVQTLIRRQLLEPLADLELRKHVNTITTIDDATSRLVQDQYEDLPYPRWLDISIHSPKPWTDVIRGMFEHYQPKDHMPANPRILIAGCGSGRHAIITASRFAEADILAVDLSKSSLAYGQRMADELGIVNIEFAQADILKLDTLNLTFDIIESVGVLHHMIDPVAGLKKLLQLLRTGGLINIGLYSQLARRSIIAAQKHLREKGYSASHADIRKAREEILALDKSSPIYNITKTNDFYSMSEFCDLIFHAQETCYTLTQVADIIARTSLQFIGFELSDPAVKKDYKQFYPEDNTLTNLSNWSAFEQRFPDTFIEMYTFWSEKV